jgi:hypothetical protein
MEVFKQIFWLLLENGCALWRSRGGAHGDVMYRSYSFDLYARITWIQIAFEGVMTFACACERRGNLGFEECGERPRLV